MGLMRALMQMMQISLAVALLQSADASAQGRPTAGPVVAIGGALRDDNEAVWGRVVQLAGGPGARFVVLATASADPDRSAARIVANLQRRGALAEHLRVVPGLPGDGLAAAVQDPASIARIDAAQGVYFSGGAQARIVDALRPGGRDSPLLLALHALHRRGGVVAGSSAGAAVQSGWMFRDPPDVLTLLQAPLREGRDIDRGLGFLPPQILIDQHLVRRGRFARMLALMAARALPLGLGVEEDSAVLVQGETAEVLGTRGVLVADMAELAEPAGSAPLAARGVRLHWLQPGDRFDLATRTPSPAPGTATSQRLDPHAPGFRGEHPARAFYADLLGENVVVNAMERLVDSPAQEAFGLVFDADPRAVRPQADPGFEFRFYKSAQTEAWRSVGAADHSVFSVMLDVRPVRITQPLVRPWPGADGAAPAP